MRLSIQKNLLWLWFLSVAFMVLCILELGALWDRNTVVTGGWSAPAFYLSALSIVINLITLKKLKIRFSEFPAVMVLLTYCFMFGRIWLNFLGLDGDVYWVLHKQFSPILMQKVGVLAVCCTHMLFLGMICTYGKGAEETRNTKLNESETNILYSLGVILLIIGIPCRLFSDIRLIQLTSTSRSFTSISARSGIIDDLAFLYVPGLLCLMESRPKLKKTLFIVLVFYFIAIMAVTGDRRYYVSAIVMLGAYILYKEDSQEKTRKWGKTIGICVLIAVFLNFLEVVRTIRHGNLSDFFGFIIGHGSDVFVLDNLLFDVLAELGISFFSLVVIVSCFPSVFSFKYGGTFIKTIPSVLPIGFLVGTWFKEASPSTYANSFAKKPVGATLFGDMFANFGIVCLLGVFLSGVVMGKLVSKKTANSCGYSCVMHYTYFYILINLIRCSVFEVFRPMVWCTILPYFLMTVLKRKQRAALNFDKKD